MDLESLLQPISEDSPSGSDIRANTSPTSLYYQLKDARNQARAAERKSLFDPGDTTATGYWQTILDQAPRVLQNTAKDIEVLCWYVEALARKQSFSDLLFGISLLKEVISRFWEDVYPHPDEDGLITRIAPITGLNGEGAEGVLIAPIRNIELTNRGGEDFTFWQYQQALDIQKITDDRKRGQQIENVGFSLEMLEKAVAETRDEKFLEMRNAVAKCITEYKELGQLLDERCGELSPPTRNVIEVLEDCHNAILHLYRNRIPEPAAIDGTETADSVAVAGGSTTAATARAIGPIKTREDAFAQLIQISDFFRKTEPHSPLSYVLEKAVKWGRMPLADLIKELIPDSSALRQYQTLTGINENDE